MTSDGIVVANAPVSYGAFEITVGIHPLVPESVELLNHVAAAGYAGIDLGPLGYLGSDGELAERLEHRQLGLAGGYFELPYSEPDALAEALPALDQLLDVFDTVPSKGNAPPPRPTLADAGSAQRAALPGRSALDRSSG